MLKNCFPSCVHREIRTKETALKILMLHTRNDSRKIIFYIQKAHLWYFMSPEDHQRLSWDELYSSLFKFLKLIKNIVKIITNISFAPLPSINLFNLRNFHKHVDSSHMEALKRVFMKYFECLFSINFNLI